MEKFLVKIEYFKQTYFGIETRAMSDEVEEFDTLEEAKEYLSLDNIVSYKELSNTDKNTFDTLSISKLTFDGDELVGSEPLDFYVVI